MQEQTNDTYFSCNLSIWRSLVNIVVDPSMNAISFKFGQDYRTTGAVYVVTSDVENNVTTAEHFVDSFLNSSFRRLQLAWN